MEACWLSQAQEGQTEQIHPQTFDEPFFDDTGMIYVHWVHIGQTVNKEYYVEVLREFWLFPTLKENLRGCRYETIEEMKEVVTKVIDTLIQENFHGAFQKLLERYNKCIAAGGDYFEGD